MADSEPTAFDAVLATLRSMHEVTVTDPTWLRRDKRITIRYEFVLGDELRCFTGAAHGPDWSFDEVTTPDEECDVVLRSEPRILLEVLHGISSGREAMLSGSLSMRKVPSHPSLLLMRAMFNRYTKSRDRGGLTDLGVGEVPEMLVVPTKVRSAGPDGSDG